MAKYDPSKLNTKVVKEFKVKLIGFLDNNITKPKGRPVKVKRIRI